MLRTDWRDLSPEVRAAIEQHTGPVRSAHTATAGRNSAIAAVLHADAGTVFVKGLRHDHPGVITQYREAAVNPHVRHLAMPMLWHMDVAEWSLLGFSYTPGMHADYRPGSPDLPKLLITMRRLADLPCPDLPQLKRAEDRWADHVDYPDDLDLLRGNTLLHTDYSPDNVLVHGSVARLIDWAWPTRGAAFIDPCCLIVRLIHAGHTPASAEACVANLPAWRAAPDRAVDVFAVALATMWSSITAVDPDPWKQHMAASAAVWRTYRAMRHR